MAVQGLQFHCEAFAFCVPSRSASHRVLPDCSTGWDVVRYPPGNDRNDHIIPFQAGTFEDVVPFPKDVLVPRVDVGTTEFKRYSVAKSSKGLVRNVLGF